MLKLFGSSMVPTASAITASVVAVLATVVTQLLFSSDSRTVEQNRNYRIQAESVNIHENFLEDAIDMHSFFGGWNRSLRSREEEWTESIRMHAFCPTPYTRQEWYSKRIKEERITGT